MSALATHRITLTLLTVLAVASCAELPRLAGGWPPAPPDAKLGALADEMHGALLQAQPPLDHAVLQAYVSEVGRRLAAQTPWPRLNWRFTVLDASEINAFALPAGQVYLTRGLLAFPNSEAELAALIAHEIGHVVAGHGAHDVRGGRGAAEVAAHWAEGYGRERELEASALAAEYLARAGYDPRALLDVMTKLKLVERYLNTQARSGGVVRHGHHAALTLRPGRDARLEEAVEAARRHAALATRADADYLGEIAGLAFGERAEDCILRGALFLHGGFGVAIEFPPGWSVQHDAAHAVATNAQGDARVELLRGKGAQQAALQAAFRFDRGVRYSEGTLSGFPALFAAGTQGGRPLIAAAISADGGPYLVAGIADDAAAYARERLALRAAINSVRALSETERRTVRPPVLRVVRAGPDDSVARLAKGSPLGQEGEAWLRLINGWYPRGEPVAGQRLKIVE
ncbi:MAG: M48 family metalloprotease [Thiobacillus sp.]